VDYETLKQVRPDLIWASISAMGTQYPDAPGYDPIIQAMSGLMAMTGFPDGPPIMSGVQITDLKAGDELYASVLLAIIEHAESGRGKRIDISMLQAATSWLVTVLPNIDISDDRADIGRSGNFHRIFVPTGVYATSDGFLYIAIGNTLQWRALVKLQPFSSLDAGGRWDTLAARAADKDRLHAAMRDAVRTVGTAELSDALRKTRIPHAPINTIEEVHALPAVRSRMPQTRTPDGRYIRLAPMAVDSSETPPEYEFAPTYGQHTEAVLTEIHVSNDEIREFRHAGVVA
jgi:crotonobetainyl-CoA:carnitine CoA-transferase CaiB-like acyl-CoA transferase